MTLLHCISIYINVNVKCQQSFVNEPVIQVDKTVV